jgi:hypothetical protein
MPEGSFFEITAGLAGGFSAGQFVTLLNQSDASCLNFNL